MGKREREREIPVGGKKEEKKKTSSLFVFPGKQTMANKIIKHYITTVEARLEEHKYNDNFHLFIYSSSFQLLRS